jgi:L-malate glycosyltransferase
MEERARLKIGITCYPLIGGSGILATALGSGLAQRGHEVHFFSSALPVRLDLAQPGISFHEVVVNEYSLFTYPDYTLPLAVRMAQVAQDAGLDIFHVHYAVPHATAAYLAVQMLNASAKRPPKIITTLHGTDTTLLGQDPSYRPAIEHALSHSDAITTVSESLRGETLEAGKKCDTNWVLRLTSFSWFTFPMFVRSNGSTCSCALSRRHAARTRCGS